MTYMAPRGLGLGLGVSISQLILGGDFIAMCMNERYLAV